MKIAQDNLELVRLRFEQVGFSNPTAWGSALKDATTAANLIKSNRQYLVAESRDPVRAERLFDQERTGLTEQLTILLDAIRDKDIKTTRSAQESTAQTLADLRVLELPKNKLPYNIPEEYSQLPRLNGLATVEMVLEKGGKGFDIGDGKKQSRVTIKMTVDGYHAPLTAGNFIDLVNKKYYDNMPMQKIEQLTVQTGQGQKAPRTIPLELFYKNDKEPVYGITSDDDLRATETMALPFQAYGALGMARQNDVPDSGDSQFFFLKWQQALIAPGRNTLDGFYSCFGYVVDNEDYIGQLNVQTDKIVTAKVIDGLDNLEMP